jgi:hypothetical protein
MKPSVRIAFLILALVFFLCAAFGAGGRVSWRDAAYACLVAAFLFG